MSEEPTCDDTYACDPSDDDADGSADEPCPLDPEYGIHMCAMPAKTPHGVYPIPHFCECGGEWMGATSGNGAL